MQVFKIGLFRAFIAIIAGGLMIQYREQMVTWATICIGVMFFISGITSIIAYYAGKRKFGKNKEDNSYGTIEQTVIVKPVPPFAGLGSIILGLILIFMPTVFTDFLQYIFAGIIIIGAIGEYASLVSATNTIKKYNAMLKEANSNENDLHTVPHCGIVYWVIPTLLLLFGLYAILDPIAIKSSPFLFIGIAIVLYGVSEIIHSIKFHNVHKRVVIATNENTKAIEEHIHNDSYIDNEE